jgi:hypothetical protein
LGGFNGATGAPITLNGTVIGSLDSGMNAATTQGHGDCGMPTFISASEKDP